MSLAILFTRKHEHIPATPAAAISTSPQSTLPPEFIKCFCTEGKKTEVLKTLRERKAVISEADCEEVPLNQLGQKISSFLERWDTEGFSPLHLQQERKVWKDFFLQPRDNSFGISSLDFYREIQQ